MWTYQMQYLIAYVVVTSIMYVHQLSRCCILAAEIIIIVLQMKHLMVDLATLLVCSCSIYVSLVFLGVCGSSEAHDQVYWPAWQRPSTARHMFTIA